MNLDVWYSAVWYLQKIKWALYWVEIGKVVDVRKKRDKNVGPFGIEVVGNASLVYERLGCDYRG